MDRKQQVSQRVREYFGERLDDVVEMVRQDRQDMRSWQEPAHVRGMMRSTRRLESGEDRNADKDTLTERSLGDADLGSALGEPDAGRRREMTSQLLELGVSGLLKATRGTGSDLTAQETLGLEAVLLLYGRPAVLVTNEGIESPPPFWNQLEDLREEVELTQRGVGRIELLGHPEYDWAGTGFLVSDNVLMTTRRIAELFTEPRDGGWQFRPGISAWMNYRPGFQDVSAANYRIRAVIGIHDRYDLALFEVERPQVNGTSPVPLSLAAQPPSRREGQQVYLVGYPVRDARRNEPETISRLFRDVYNVKRVQPGQLRGELTFGEITLLRHDAAPLGQNAGAPVIDLETQQVLAMQSTGRFMEASTAVPLYLLRDDALLQKAGVSFAEATPRDRQNILGQVERLARSRYWNEARSMIENLYARAFGYETNRR